MACARLGRIRVLASRGRLRGDMAGQFEGRVALVTGAARNIGRATAVAFAREGADVAITALTHGEEAEAVAGEIQALGRHAMVCMVDTSDGDAVRDMATRLLT